LLTAMQTGGTLEDVASGAASGKRTPPSSKEILQWLYEALLGLADLHKHNIAHHDIALRNLFLTSSGSLKIGDVGLATRLTHGVCYEYPLAPERLFRLKSTSRAQRSSLPRVSSNSIAKRCWELHHVIRCLHHVIRCRGFRATI